MHSTRNSHDTENEYKVINQQNYTNHVHSRPIHSVVRTQNISICPDQLDWHFTWITQCDIIVTISI